MKKKINKATRFEEIDIINFKQDEYKGYDYVVFYFERGIMGHLNGYVRIPESHPAYKLGTKWTWYQSKIFTSGKREYSRDYDKTELNVHGGLTFGNVIDEKNKAVWFLGILDIKPGFWVGWDYLHAGDEMFLSKDRIIEKPEYVQKMYAELMAIHNQYPDLLPDKRWEFDEVEADCKNAIDQLIELEHGYPKCADCGKEFNPEDPDMMLCWSCDFKQENKKKEFKKI